MAGTNILARRPFWAALVAVLLGAAWLYLGRDLDIGTFRAPGPGAFPLALSIAVLLFGAAELLRAVAWPRRSNDTAGQAPLWRSPIFLAAVALAVIAAAPAFFGPYYPHFARYGVAAVLAWYALALILCAVAASLVPGGSLTRALGAVLIGLLLGTSGLDPLITTVERYASVELGLWLIFVHGLILAVVAYHIGLNALLIAAAAALSPKIEKALRESLAGADGSLAAFLDEPVSLALLAAAFAALAAGVWLRLAQSTAAPAAGASRAEAAPPLLARPAFWAGAVALLGGIAAFYFGTGIGLRISSELSGAFGPGAAPMALSAALVLVGVVQIAAAIGRDPAPEGPPRPLSRSPATIGAIVLMTLLVVLLFVLPVAIVALGQPAVDFFLRFGPVEFAALTIFILTLCVAAAWLLPRGSFVRALGAVLIGLLLGTLGLDAITGVVRYVMQPDFELAHGLAIGYLAYRMGFNPLLIAIGFLHSEKLENALRQTFLISQGDPAVFADRSYSLALLLAAIAVLAVAAWLRWLQRR